MNYEELTKKLIYEAQSGSDVEKILAKENLLDPVHWKPIGKSTGNFGTIGNQSPTADQALAERIVNSVDAELMRACVEQGFPLRSSNAPKSMTDAAEKLFGIPQGKLHSYLAKGGSKITDIVHIHLSATGYQGIFPTLNLVDQGEGQTPDKMEDTFFSLPAPTQDPYKVGIPFVQGRFNQGSTGSYIYSSYVFVLTRRAPRLLDSSASSRDHDWGWSIVKRFPPPTDDAQSIYKYLAPFGKIQSFQADELNLIPDKIPPNYEQLKPDQLNRLAYALPISSGTLVKLFDYEVKYLISDTIWNPLYRNLNRIFYEIPLPVRLHEMRKHLLRGKGDATNLNGMLFALMQDRSEVVEVGFPNNEEITIEGVGKITLYIWAMNFSKHDTGAQKSVKWFGDDAISFVINGQSHYHLPKRVLGRSDVGLDFLQGSLFVTVDMTKVPRDNLEMIFKTDRSGIREDKEVYQKLEKECLHALREHAGLQSLNEKRYSEEVAGSKTDTKTAAKVLSELVNTNPIFRNALFGNEIVVKGGFDWEKVEGKKYRGKPSPTFFRIKAMH